MKHIAFLLLTYGAILLQTNSGLQIALGFLTPDFLMLIVVLALVKAEGWPAIIWAAMLGLVSDCLTAEHLGIQMLSATVTAWFIQRTLGDCWWESAWSVALLSFITVFWTTVIANLLRMALAGRTVDFITFLQTTTGISAASALFALIALPAWRTIQLLPRRGHTPHTEAANHWKMLTP